jgi:hypothetical protein
MGYCIQQTDANFFIPAELFGSALEAIKTNLNEYQNHNRWADTEQVLSAKELSVALKHFRWRVGFNRLGDIDSIYFTGEKGGSYEPLFSWIAPYVVEGSYITMVGEDHATWRWYFDGQKCSTQNGRTVWE